MTFEEAKKRIKELDSGSRFGGSDYESGWEDALRRVTEVLDEIDTEPVRKPDKMTLKELAHELRKIFKFKWLTVDEGNEIQLWVCFSEDDPPEFYEDGCWYSDSPMTDELCSILPSVGLFAIGLDLSEYRDADGNIDYSKCIVEVTDDIN